MPIYEYVCEKCGSHVEVMQKVADAPLKRCGRCRGKLEKLVSRTSFQLKGSGWYKTDYSGKDSRKAAPTVTEKTEKATDKKSESTSKTTASGEGD